MAQAVSCQPLTAEARIHAQVSPCEICGGQSGTGFSQVASVIRAMMMETLRTPVTSVYSNETTRRYIPKGCNLHTRRHENLKFHNQDYFLYNLLFADDQVVIA
jgi:hypothetical protein